jgi:hypothetical protein
LAEPPAFGERWCWWNVSIVALGSASLGPGFDEFEFPIRESTFGHKLVMAR